LIFVVNYLLLLYQKHLEKEKMPPKKGKSVRIASDDEHVEIIPGK
jgi:hypothetical protein